MVLGFLENHWRIDENNMTVSEMESRIRAGTDGAAKSTAGWFRWR
jgi:hypothetical protein